jgi:PAS domain S-box-containing protein
MGRKVPAAVHVRCEERGGRFTPVPGSDFAFLANSIPQLVWSSDSEGACDYFNQRWFDYTGSTYEQSSGNGWQYVIHAEDLERTIRVWQEAMRNGQVCAVEHRLRHRSGEYRWHLTKAAPMRSADGSIERWFGTCTDVHDQKQSGMRQAEKASREAEAELSSQLAHEINNPLNATMNLLYLAQLFPERSPAFAAQAELQVKKIARLVAGILNLR